MRTPDGSLPAVLVFGSEGMRRPVELTTGFPSAARAAKRLGVTQRDARKLALLAERSRKNSAFVLPTVGRLSFVKSTLRKGLSAPQAIKIFTRDVATSRTSKRSSGGTPVPKK